MMSHRSEMRFLAALAFAGALLAAASAASAASISYGNFGPVPPGVTFGDVTESSGTDAVPLYGAPGAFATGLDFDPAGFVATGTGGAIDLTDGQLNFTITTDPSLGILALNLAEAGDFSLQGVGTSATQAAAGAIVRVIVTQIDGVNVAPISLVPTNASVAFNLAANPGIVNPWSLGIGVDIVAQLGGGQRATQLEVVIDNQLSALSEANSAAFIAKKDFRIEVTAIPEPSTALLLLGACAALTAVARVRR